MKHLVTNQDLYAGDSGDVYNWDGLQAIDETDDGVLSRSFRISDKIMAPLGLERPHLLSPPILDLDGTPDAVQRPTQSMRNKRGDQRNIDSLLRSVRSFRWHFLAV